MQRTITGFRVDGDGHWVAELDCGHGQHMRDDPPWQNRPWTRTAAGRMTKLGEQVDCLKCDRGEPPADWYVAKDPSLLDAAD